MWSQGTTAVSSRCALNDVGRRLADPDAYVTSCLARSGTPHCDALPKRKASHNAPSRGDTVP